MTGKGSLDEDFLLPASYLKTKMILLLGTIAIAFNTLAQSPKAYVTNYGEDYISVIDILQNRNW